MKKLCVALAQNELFAGLDHDTFSQFCSRVNMRLAWKGEVVANEGDESNGIGLVVTGQLAMQKYARNGDYVTLALLGPGDVFGEDLLFAPDRSWPLTIEAISNARIIMLTRDILLPLIRDNQELMENFASFLSQRIHEQNRRITILSQRNLRQKITVYLLDLLDKQTEEEEREAGPGRRKSVVSTPAVELPVSKEVAARLLAMPRPSFSRELVRMEKDGLIRVSGRVIWLTDLERLEQGDADEDI